MRVAAVVVDSTFNKIETSVLWIDPEERRILKKIAVPYAPNVEIVPQSGAAVVAYTSYNGGEMRFTADIYGLEDWRQVASLPMDCRATFNVRQVWPSIQPSPQREWAYMYKSKTLGDNLGENIVCGLDLARNRFSDWEFPLSQNVIDWAGPAGRAHAQFLFTSEDSIDGEPTSSEFEHSVGFWLGPEQGMGPVISIGPQPRLGSDLGRARAICTSQSRTVVVRNDGRIHLLDPVSFRHLGVQRLQVPAEDVVVGHAAAMEPTGRFLYVGTATHDFSCSGISERIVVHDLDLDRRVQVWELERKFQHFSLTERGDYLFGAASDGPHIDRINASTGEVEDSIAVEGRLHYIIATSEA